jgi:hypothetical protein
VDSVEGQRRAALQELCLGWATWPLESALTLSVFQALVKQFVDTRGIEGMKLGQMTPAHPGQRPRENVVEVVDYYFQHITELTPNIQELHVNNVSHKSGFKIARLPPSLKSFDLLGTSICPLTVANLTHIGLEVTKGGNPVPQFQSLSLFHPIGGELCEGPVALAWMLRNKHHPLQELFLDRRFWPSTSLDFDGPSIPHNVAVFVIQPFLTKLHLMGHWLTDPCTF